MELEKKIIVLESRITVEVDERVELHENIKEAIKAGCFKYVGADVRLFTNDGIVCNDDNILNQVRDAIIWGLEEKG